MEITETNDVGELLNKVLEIKENCRQMVKYTELIRKLSKLFYSLSDLSLI